MARITWNRNNDDTLNLFKNGGIFLTGRNLNPAWVKLQREKLEAQKAEEDKAKARKGDNGKT